MERLQPPIKQSELIEDFDAMDEAKFIVNQAFGDDYKRDLIRLNKERLHAEGCGCTMCHKNYEAHIMEAVYKYSAEEPTYGATVTVYDSKK